MDDIKTLLADAKKFTQAMRDRMAKSGEAMPDGSFPIRDEKDLRDAIDDWGRAGSKPDAKEHIIKRAKALGEVGLLPNHWK